MTRPLVILGASGNALDVLDVVDAINAHSKTWEVRGFLDDSRAVGSRFAGLAILGKLTDAAGMSGACHLEPACYVGAGALLRQRVRVGTGALVGMGAVVLRDVPPSATVIGNPARPLERPAPQRK